MCTVYQYSHKNVELTFDRTYTHVRDIHIYIYTYIHNDIRGVLEKQFVFGEGHLVTYWVGYTTLNAYTPPATTVLQNALQVYTHTHTHTLNNKTLLNFVLIYIYFIEHTEYVQCFTCRGKKIIRNIQ